METHGCPFSFKFRFVEQFDFQIVAPLGRQHPTGAGDADSHASVRYFFGMTHIGTFLRHCETSPQTGCGNPFSLQCVALLAEGAISNGSINWNL